mgnify:CR=1 FL=1
MTIDRNRLIAIIQKHLKLRFLYDALDFRGGKFKYHPHWPVVQTRRRSRLARNGGPYYDCMVWERADKFCKADRPKCQTRLYVSIFGEIMEKPAAGARKKPSTVDTCAVQLYPYQRRLPDDMYKLLGLRRARFLRGVLYGASCRMALMAAKKDMGIHVRKLEKPGLLYGGWSVFDGEGNPMMPTDESPIKYDYEWQAWISAYPRLIMDCLLYTS